MFRVHEKLIRHYSPPCFEERPKQFVDGVHLEDVMPETLEMALEWIYTKTLSNLFFDVAPTLLPHGSKPELAQNEVRNEDRSTAVMESDNENASKSSTSEITLSKDNGIRCHTPASSVTTQDQTTTPIADDRNLAFDQLLDLYVFATKYKFPLLGIAAIKQWQQLGDKGLRCPKSVYLRVYDLSSLENTMLLSMMAYDHALWVKSAPREEPKMDEADMSKAFLHEVLRFTRSFTSSDVVRRMRANRCMFHDHEFAGDSKADCKAQYNAIKDQIETKKRKHELEQEYNRLMVKVERHGEYFVQVKSNSKKLVKDLKVDKNGLLIAM